jgi:hypothetical protein
MVDGAEHGLAAVSETDSAAPQGDAGRVVVGAVDGVDKPGPAAWLRTPLLGDDAVLRAGGAQPVDDQRLSGVIGWSDEVRDRCLARGLHPGAPHVCGQPPGRPHEIRRQRQIVRLVGHRSTLEPDVAMIMAAEAGIPRRTAAAHASRWDDDAPAYAPHLCPATAPLTVPGPQPGPPAPPVPEPTPPSPSPIPPPTPDPGPTPGPEPGPIPGPEPGPLPAIDRPDR